MPDATFARSFVKDATGKVRFDAVPKVGETKVDFTESPAKLNWRLVHDGVQVLALFESDGITWTKNVLYCGIQKECDQQITLLGLKPLPDDSIATTGKKAVN